jgi:hypothetical protein
MSEKESSSPPDLEDHIAKVRLELDESKDTWLLFVAGAIAIFVLLLILSATAISLSVPRISAGNASTAQGKKGADTRDGEFESGIVETQNGPASAVSSSEATMSQRSSVDTADRQAEKQDEDLQSESSAAIERKEIKPEASPGVHKSDEVANRKASAADELQVDKPADGIVNAEKQDNVFMIHLPEPGNISDLGPPANSISSKSPMYQRSAEERLEKLETNGGTAESELAVAAALEWLAKHQLPNGQWSFDHRPRCDGTCTDVSQVVHAEIDPRMLANAATGLSLLPFLGAGFTHRDGKYQEVVRKGIDYLLESQRRDTRSSKVGSWMEPTGFMYSHGIASMAICEAYAMTEDPKLKPAAQAGLNFIAMAQHSGGGWRYQPGQPGDMSMLGWHLMALKSGQLAELGVDRKCFSGAERFIESLRINSGGAYGYESPMSNGHDRCTTAIAALGLYYLARDNQSIELQAAVKLISQAGPDLEDLYGLYYSTQVMMHLGGDDWPRWNEKVREHLISSQATDGHSRGSWYITGSDPHRASNIGGRLYCTSMSAMILEVYYRHLPLYVKKRP